MRLPCPPIEAGFYLTRNHKGNPDFVTSAETVGKVTVTPEEIRQAVGVDSNFYFHLSGSICR